MIRRLLNFFRMRYDLERCEFHWLWWSVTDEMIEDEQGLGPMQSAWDAFGAKVLRDDLQTCELLTSGRFRMTSFRTEKYVWNEKRQAYDYAGHGPWISRSWFDGKELI